MTENTSDKLEVIVAGTIMVLLSPVILVVGIGSWFVVEYLLDEDDKYTLFRKW